MNAEQLADTTMNPEKRTLLVLSPGGSASLLKTVSKPY